MNSMDIVIRAFNCWADGCVRKGHDSFGLPRMAQCTYQERNPEGINDERLINGNWLDELISHCVSEIDWKIVDRLGCRSEALKVHVDGYALWLMTGQRVSVKVIEAHQELEKYVKGHARYQLHEKRKSKV